MATSTKPPAKRKRGRPRITALTDSQRRTLEAIERFLARNGIPPTTQELADILGMTTSGAYDLVGQLVRKGYVQRKNRRARSLTIVRRADEDGIAALVPIPLVGHVAAGQPMWSDEDLLGEVLVSGNVARGGRCFGLKISGESMTGAGIKDGDVVVVRQQPLAESGDVVVALVDGESTVKRLYWSDDTIELRPENGKYRPITIVPETDFRILGKVIAHSHLRFEATTWNLPTPAGSTSPASARCICSP